MKIIQSNILAIAIIKVILCVSRLRKRKINKIQAILLRYLKIRIANITELNEDQLGHSTQEHLFFVVSQLLTLKHNEKDTIRLEQIKKQVSQTIKIVKHDRHVQSSIDMYQMLENNYTKIHFLERDSIKELYYILLNNITRKNLTKINNNIKKQYKEEFKNYRSKHTIHIGLKINNLSNLLAVVTPILFVASYIRTNIYFTWFGIKTSEYFTISDYISNSIDDLKSAIAAFAWLAFGALLRVSTLFHKNPLEKERLQKGVNNIVLCILAAFTIAGLVLKYRTTNTIDYNIIRLLIIPITLLLLFKLSQHYITFSPHIAIVSYFSTFLFLNLTSYSLERIQNFKNGNFEVIEINLTNTSPDTCLSNCIYIGSNSNYLFFNDINNNLNIIPRYTIEYIKVNPFGQ